jgi:hypothetical protein
MKPHVESCLSAGYAERKPGCNGETTQQTLESNLIETNLHQEQRFVDPGI